MIIMLIMLEVTGKRQKVQFPCYGTSNNEVLTSIPFWKEIETIANNLSVNFLLRHKFQCLNLIYQLKYTRWIMNDYFVTKWLSQKFQLLW